MIGIKSARAAREIVRCSPIASLSAIVRADPIPKAIFQSRCQASNRDESAPLHQECARDKDLRSYSENPPRQALKPFQLSKPMQSLRRAVESFCPWLNLPEIRGIEDQKAIEYLVE